MYKQKVIFLNIKSRWLTLSKYCMLLQIFTNCIWKCQGHARVKFECFDLSFVIQGLLKSCTHWYVADPKPHCKVSLCCRLKISMCFLFCSFKILSSCVNFKEFNHWLRNVLFYFCQEDWMQILRRISDVHLCVKF